MSDKRGVIGGFAAVNTNSGQIDDCYCVTKFNGSKYTAGGFIGENAGRIKSSFCTSVARGLTGGFCGKSSAVSKSCFYVEKNKEKDGYWDKSNAVESSDIRNEADAGKLGFDTDQVWTMGDESARLKFNPATWRYDSPFPEDGKKKIIHIKSGENLRQFAELVNNGNTKAAKAWVQLEADIDLKGEEWTPIGHDRTRAFQGIFNGNGHTVKNFIIKGDDYTKKGFFGYLRGQVYNFAVDCQIKGEGTIGSVAAVNEGIIGCCGATLTFVGKGADLNVGGLVGNNSGKVFKSFAAGSIKFILLPILPLLVLLSAATVAGATVFSVTPAIKEAGSLYGSLDGDKNQYRISSDRELQLEDTEGVNTVISFTFGNVIEVNSETAECTIDYENPGISTNNAVIELQVKDGNTYTTIAKSGKIQPGYGIKNLTLQDSAYSILSVGDLEGQVVLKSYDVNSDEKSIIDTVLPVVLRVY